jgi:hypothetical protein
LHNSWLYESEKAWATQRIKLKYPDIPPYPTEQDVLERAQTLLKFLVLGNSNSITVKDIELSVVLPEEVKEETVPVVEITHSEEPIEETTIEQVVTEPIVEKEEPSGRILPTVLKKLEQMRNKF